MNLDDFERMLMHTEAQGLELPTGSLGVWHQPGIEDQLREAKEHLEVRLADVDAALEALEANPEVLRVMNLVSKAQRGW